MTKREREILAAAMRTLEQLPRGGIGEDGKTLAELNAEAEGEVEDGVEWTGQYAWRIMEQLL